MVHTKDAVEMVSLQCKSAKKTDKTFFLMAAEMAEKSPLPYKYGCVIVRRGKVIACGYNHYGMSPFSGIYATHAEVDALNHCYDKNDLKGARVYVTRINNKGGGPRSGYSVLSGKPCSECHTKLVKMMKKYGLKDVFYTIDSYLSL